MIEQLRKMYGFNDHEAIAYKWQYRYMGDFETSLMETIGLADINNRARLRLSFPDHVDTMNKYQNDENFWPDAMMKQERIEEQIRELAAEKKASMEGSDAEV